MHENYKGKRFLFERMRLSLSARDGATEQIGPAIALCLRRRF
jgi:hypothetical protein